MTDMKSKKRPPRQVPVLSAEAEAFLSAISTSGNFTLEAVLARYSDGPPPPEVLLALKEASIARHAADANAAAKNGTLQPITAEQYAVPEKASTMKHGNVISSIMGALEAADQKNMESKNDDPIPAHVCDCSRTRISTRST